jgi:hypothetical protein
MYVRPSSREDNISICMIREGIVNGVDFVASPLGGCIESKQCVLCRHLKRQHKETAAMGDLVRHESMTLTAAAAAARFAEQTVLFKHCRPQRVVPLASVCKCV